MKEFVKTYKSEKHGFVAVLCGSENDNADPEVRFFFHFEDLGLGISSMTLIYPDTEVGHMERDEVFDGMSLATVNMVMDETRKSLGKSSDIKSYMMEDG